MLARKQIVETLQANRTEAVHLLDQLVRQLPDGIYLKSVKQVGREGDAGRLRAVERPRVDADAQHRELAVAGEAGAGRDQVGGGARAGTQDSVNEFTLNLQIKRQRGAGTALPAPPPKPRHAHAAKGAEA